MIQTTKNDLIPIEQVEIEETAGTTYYEVVVEVNGKTAYITLWFSYEKENGETDFGYEISDDSDDLNEFETYALEDWITDRQFDLKN